MMMALVARAREWTRHPVTWLLASSGVLVAGLWVGALRIFPRDEVAAILHYRSQAGIDFVGEGSHITVLPAVGTLLVVMNFVLGMAAARADRRAAWVLWSSLPLYPLVLLAAFYFIWQINRYA